ncbi:MAG: bifunctional proline dehydrogenase/L-glutamate gamma-semialdehyde dehydrogenase [Phycisphaerales bacterium]|nr:bifunctional proline dehydrogenase/L-glutamate gamma-semialdehyde dehydrogenase [Phycisphaerales bacterium]
MTLTRIHSASLEPDIRRIGRHIFELAEAAGPSVFSIEYWQQKAMTWLTGNDDLKLRLFRFVEVLPFLQSNEAIARHLAEYLGDDFTPPEPLNLAVAFDRPDSMYASLVASAAKFGCGIGAKQFIAGDTPQQAIRKVKRLRTGGNTFTLDVLGETIIADRIARHHQQLYLDLIEHVSRDATHWPDIPMIDVAPWGRIPKVNISLKLSAIVVSFDPINPTGSANAILDRLRPVLRAARDRGAFVNVDMEHYAVKDLTLDIFKRVMTEPEFHDWPDCGIVIQCYMPEGDRDLAELVAWTRKRGTPISVRLVKGAYWDSETAMAVRNGWESPLYKEKWESDAAYERVGRVMLENCDVIRPAFASHNVRTIAAMLAMESALGLPSRTLELQMLTGMGEPLRRALTRMQQRVRVYAPFGDMMTGMAYLTRRLIENTANESFLRQSFGGDTPVDQLLRKPAPSRRATQSPQQTKFLHASQTNVATRTFQAEPEVNFADPPVRDEMHKALARTRAEFGEKLGPIINNETPSAAEWRPSRNPSSPAEVVGYYAVCDAAVVDLAANAARRAAAAWAAQPASARADFLDRAADALHTARYDLMALASFETGKTWREAAGDYLDTVDAFRYYAAEARRLSSANGEALRARGVVGVIAPYSFPLSLIGGMTAAALVAGNAVIMKPAVHSSICAARLCRILIDAGLPAGVLNFVTGPGELTSRALVQHGDVDVIAFTGSRRVGSLIREQARETASDRGAAKIVIAEAGGKHAIIVDDDADMDEAVQATIASAFGFSGQKCTACSRVVVLDAIYDAFLEKLKEAAEAITPKQADDPAARVGPLIDESGLARYDEALDHVRRAGRLVLAGGRTDADSGGYFANPSIVTNLATDAEPAQEAIMAPILNVLRADTFERAVSLANDAPDSRVGGLYSRSPSHIAYAKERFAVATLHVNRKMTLSRIDRQGVGPGTATPDFLARFCDTAAQADRPATVESASRKKGKRGAAAEVAR